MTSGSRHIILLPIALAFIALGWRVAKLGFGFEDPFPNFSPWLALAFAGAVVMPTVIAWWVWPLIIVSTDVLLATGDMSQMWSVYACYALAGLLGSSLRGRLGGMGTVGGTVLCALGFYVITSTQSWWMSPAYAKSISGWLQALTMGDPAWQPQAWVFAVRSMLSEGLFAFLLVFAYNGEAVSRRLQGLSWQWSQPPEAAAA
jgi:hypothetical protein